MSAETDLYEAAHQAFLATHPDRDPNALNNDPEAIEWRHGYVTAARKCGNVRPEKEEK